MAIISFRHNFIFVKTTKTAGTSIEVELAKRIDDEAIVTPVIPPVEGHTPRNWQRGFLRKSYYNHMPATHIRAHLGRKRFEDMYRFCVEREPVSKCISHFHMLKNSPDHSDSSSTSLTWEEYCARGKFPIDIEKYAERRDGRWVRMVHDVLPYEALNETLRSVLAHNGMEPFDLSTKAKAEYSTRRYITVKDVTTDQRERIYAAFADSIAVAGLGERYTL